MPYEVLALEAAIGEADDFDVIHFHEACLHLPWTRRIRCATVTTMHGRLDLRDLVPLYREYAEVPLVSISDAQREPMPWANWHATVYHGLPDDLYRFHPEPGGYLAFLGRICPEKRVDRAIAIAKRAGIELKIAAKVDAADQEYFETEIRHLLDDPLVDFIGEIGDGQKEAFLGGAAALLMPIGWPEPFGLVVIEAMACGTPVIAFPFGSMPELIEPGVNGFLVESAGVGGCSGPGARRARPQAVPPFLRRALHHGSHGRELRACVRGSRRGAGIVAWSIRAARARYLDPGSCARGGRGAAASHLARPSRRQRVTTAMRAEARLSTSALSTSFFPRDPPPTVQTSTEACGMKDSQRPGICATLEACEAPMPCGSLCRHTSESMLTGPLLSISTSSRRSWRSSGGRRSSGAHCNRSSKQRAGDASPATMRPHPCGSPRTTGARSRPTRWRNRAAGLGAA